MKDDIVSMCEYCGKAKTCVIYKNNKKLNNDAVIQNCLGFETKNPNPGEKSVLNSSEESRRETKVTCKSYKTW